MEIDYIPDIADVLAKGLQSGKFVYLRFSPNRSGQPICPARAYPVADAKHKNVQYDPSR